MTYLDQVSTLNFSTLSNELLSAQPSPSGALSNFFGQFGFTGTGNVFTIAGASHGLFAPLTGGYTNYPTDNPNSGVGAPQNNNQLSPIERGIASIIAPLGWLGGVVGNAVLPGPPESNTAATDTHGNPITQGADWVGFVETLFGRLAIIVVGFIFVGVGLTMFKPQAMAVISGKV